MGKICFQRWKFSLPTWGTSKWRRQAETRCTDAFNANGEKFAPPPGGGGGGGAFHHFPSLAVPADVYLSLNPQLSTLKVPPRRKRCERYHISPLNARDFLDLPKTTLRVSSQQCRDTPCEINPPALFCFTRRHRGEMFWRFCLVRQETLATVVRMAFEGLAL